MKYNTKTLAEALGCSERHLSRHRDALEARYAVQMRSGHFYQPEYLGVLQASIKGLELPETLEGYELPPFTPIGPEATTGVVIEAELLEDFSDVDTSAMTVYTPQTLSIGATVKRQEHNLPITSVDLTALRQASAASDQGISDAIRGILDRSRAVGQILGETIASQVEQGVKTGFEEGLLRGSKKLDLGA